MVKYHKPESDTMCFNISAAKNQDKLEKRFNARFEDDVLFNPIYHASAFTRPELPVITNQEPEKINRFGWGLIPSWVDSYEKAKDISLKTANARAESVYEKPSFRNSIRDRRCLVIADGFFEWQLVRGKNYPYYIHLKNKSLFAFAGIWDSWTNPETGIRKKTFSIITTKANPMMEKIHNKKKRMPVILEKSDEISYLDNELDRIEVSEFLRPLDDSLMYAYTVSHLVSRRGVDKNTPEVLKPYDYEELHVKDLFSF